MAKPIGRDGIVNSVALIVFIEVRGAYGILFNESVVGGVVFEGVVGGESSCQTMGIGKGRTHRLG